MWRNNNLYKTINIGSCITSLSIHNNGNTLVIGTQNGRIVVYDISRNKIITALKGHEQEVTSVNIKFDYDRKKYFKYLLSQKKDYN